MSVDMVLCNPLILTTICEHLNDADTINLSLSSVDYAFQMNIDHIISTKYEVYRKKQTENIWTRVLSQIHHILQYIEPERSNHNVITKLLNEMFDFIYENKELLRMTDEGAFTIEEKLIDFIDISYYRQYALYYLEKMFDIYVKAMRNDDYECDEYDEYIVNSKGVLIYV